MAKFQITAPDGKTYEITAPDGATQDQVLAFAQSQFGGSKTPAQPSKPVDPTEGMSGVQKFIAGTGKAFYDVGRGVGTLVTDAFPEAAKYGFATRKDVDESKKLDAPLMNTGAGLAGNIAGNIAAAVPTAMIPGANTIIGGAAIGAGLGSIQPVGTDDSRLDNMKLGAASGAAVPSAIRAVKVLKALSDPLTASGRAKIVGTALNRAATDPAQAAANMRTNTGATPGFNPTAGQAANDAGVASVERTARAIDPGGFGAVDEGQRAALVNALRGIAKTPEERATAVAARDAATEALYDTAKQATVPGDATLDALMQRPSMQSAQARAASLALERGEPVVRSGGHHGGVQLGLTAAKPAQTVSTGILDASGNPITTMTPAQPATYSGKSLHDLKMGLSDAIGSPVSGMQGAERSAAVGTQKEFLQWLESKIPEYGQARQTFADMSKPINQMDVGQELYNRFVPALADTGGVPFKSRADALAQALRNGDDLVRNVTGMKGATMAGTMEPEQMATLGGIVKDAQMKAAADSVGKGVGSDTVQKMAMSNLIQQAGIPNWFGMLPVGGKMGGLIRMAGDKLYNGADDSMRRLLADTLKDPQATAAAMEKAGIAPSKIAEYLRLAAQAPVMAIPGSLPAVVNPGQ